MPGGYRSAFQGSLCAFFDALVATRPAGLLAVADMEATTRFYERVLGFERAFFREPEGNLVEVPEYAQNPG